MTWKKAERGEGRRAGEFKGGGCCAYWTRAAGQGVGGLDLPGESPTPQTVAGEPGALEMWRSQSGGPGVREGVTEANSQDGSP